MAIPTPSCQGGLNLPLADYYFPPSKWNYLYDSAPLKNTLKEFIDFKYLKETDKRS